MSDLECLHSRNQDYCNLLTSSIFKALNGMLEIPLKHKEALYTGKKPNER